MLKLVCQKTQILATCQCPQVTDCLVCKIASIVGLFFFLSHCIPSTVPSLNTLTVLPDEVKTLMFFEGCPPQLGCSIKLRGASEYELARVKEIIMLMVCVAYHSQLEISFLMDEFAMPPSLAQSTSFPCLLESTSAEEAEGEGSEKDGESQEKTVGPVPGMEDSMLGRVAVVFEPEEEKPVPESSSKNEDTDSIQVEPSPKSPSSPILEKEARNTETATSTPFSSGPAPPLSVSPSFLLEEDQGMESDTLIRESEGGGGEGECLEGDSLDMLEGEGSDTPTPRLFRDPLQDDTGLFVAEQVASSDDRLKSISAIFKQELKDIILCISPFITFREPFLLTSAGLHCPSRDYFPEQVPRFLSFQWE